MSKRSLSLAVLLVTLLLPALALAADGTGGAFEEQLAKGWVWAHLAAFGFGFLTSLTPCVYPMIPIVVGVFGARDEDVTRQRAFALATLYVLGMGVMYAALGVVFGLIGKQFGSILSNPWVVIPVVGLYIALAASMFGAFELNLPASWQSKLNQVGGKGHGGAFAMGMVGGLTAAPCTGPFLIGILGYVAATRNVAAGGSLLFVYALGMGVLFWVVGAFAASLPKSGRWMESVKSFGGIALLGVSLFFLRPIVPALAEIGGPDTLSLIVAVGLIAAGVLLGAIHLSFHDAWAVRVRKGIGVVATVAGIAVGLNWVLVVKLPWVYDETAAFAQAKAEGKGVMIDFAADWCLPCAEARAHVRRRRRVRRAGRALRVPEVRRQRGHGRRRGPAGEVERRDPAGRDLRRRRGQGTRTRGQVHRSRGLLADPAAGRGQDARRGAPCDGAGARGPCLGSDALNAC